MYTGSRGAPINGELWLATLRRSLFCFAASLEAVREEKREREVDRPEGLAGLPPCHSGEAEEAPLRSRLRPCIQERTIEKRDGHLAAIGLACIRIQNANADALVCWVLDPYSASCGFGWVGPHNLIELGASGI